MQGLEQEEASLGVEGYSKMDSLQKAEVSLSLESLQSEGVFTTGAGEFETGTYTAERYEPETRRSTEEWWIYN